MTEKQEIIYKIAELYGMSEANQMADMGSQALVSRYRREAQELERLFIEYYLK